MFVEVDKMLGSVMCTYHARYISDMHKIERDNILFATSYTGFNLLQNILQFKSTRRAKML
jgi:hypothetical protein